MKKLPNTLKLGETLLWGGSVTELEPGDWAMSAQIRNKANEKLADVVINPALVSVASNSETHAFTLSVDETVTAGFPVTAPTTPLYLDIFFRSGGTNIATDTVIFFTDKNITDIPL